MTKEINIRAWHNFSLKQYEMGLKEANPLVFSSHAQALVTPHLYCLLYHRVSLPLCEPIFQ